MRDGIFYVRDAVDSACFPSPFKSQLFKFTATLLLMLAYSWSSGPFTYPVCNNIFMTYGTQFNDNFKQPIKNSICNRIYDEVTWAQLSISILVLVSGMSELKLIYSTYIF